MCCVDIERLAELAGINTVNVDIDSGTVMITGTAPGRDKIVNRLTEMGYPEVGAI